MSRFFPLHDLRWLLLLAAALLAFAAPFLAQLRRLGRDTFEDRATRIYGHVGYLAVVLLAYRFTGKHAAIGLLAILGVVSVCVQYVAIRVHRPPDVRRRPADDGFAAGSDAAEPPLLQRSLRIHHGWNLISVPLRPLSDRTEGVLPRDLDVWSWDGEEQAFRVPERLEPGLALWIHSPEERTLELYGYAGEATPRPLSPGWNLVGPLRSHPAPRHPDLRGHWWSFDGERPVAVASLEPGRGYWVFARHATRIAF